MSVNIETLGDLRKDGAVLLSKLNKAVAAANEAKTNVTTAQAELVSRSKTVGLLLLEAKKLHPAVKDFDVFLKRVDGLKLSRAYDCMRIAGGRATDEEIREEARERKQKSRAKKKLPTPTPAPRPKPEPLKLSVTNPPVTESAEISIEERKAQHAALDQSTEEGAEKRKDVEGTTAPIDPYYEPHAVDEPPTAVLRASMKALREFKHAADTWLPKIREDMRMEAIVYVRDFFSKTKKAA
jgi:hypothetical protein